jgi:RNA-binding protein 26
MMMGSPYQPMLPFTPAQNSRHKQDSRGGQRRKKGRAPFSAEGPETDKTKSTLVVESIPEDHLNEDDVRTFFGQFGAVEELTLQPAQKLAIIKYDSWESANAAYKSPKAIFDNRFVKVFWYRDEAQTDPSHGKNPHASETTGIEPLAAIQMDPEEFERRQQEAQAKWQEREAKRAELEQQRQELERRQQEHLEKYREATEKLNGKLAEKKFGSEAEVSSTEKLRAQLARLEQEAKILGIDTELPADDASVSSFSPSYPSRGGWRGRGRGRGRGWGAWRGRGGGPGIEGRHAAYAQYSLDLRPKTVAITGVDLTAPDKDEALRQYLLVCFPRLPFPPHC